MKKSLIPLIVSIFFIFSTAVADPIVGDAASEISKTVWSVTKLSGDRVSESRMRKIAFSSPQEFKLEIDCDYYKGRYQVEGDSLRISTLTKVASNCDEESKNDAVFLNALLMVERYQLMNSGLKFFTVDGELLANLEPTSAFEVPSAKTKAHKKTGKHKKAKAGKKAKKSTGVVKQTSVKGKSGAKKVSAKQAKSNYPKSKHPK